MRLIVCLAAALLLARPLAAQTSPLSTPPLGAAAADSGAILVFNNWYLPRYQAGTTGSDTTGALLSLFRKRRYAGFLYEIPLIVGLLVALPISSTDSRGQQHVVSGAISPPIGSTILVATVAGFIVHANRFNKSHLVAIDRAYAARQPIPARYRRLLSDRHFAEAAVLRESISQQQAREQVGAAPAR